MKLKKICESIDETKCALCGKDIISYGNNGMPLVDGKVCDDCNEKVIEARIEEIKNRRKNSSLDECQNFNEDYNNKYKHFIIASNDMFEDYFEGEEGLKKNIDFNEFIFFTNNPNNIGLDYDDWDYIVENILDYDKYNISVDILKSKVIDEDGFIDTNKLLNILKSGKIKENLEEKKKQGYFVKYNSGDVEKGTEFFNKNMGDNNSTSENAMTEEKEEKPMSFEEAKKYLKDKHNIDLTKDTYKDIMSLAGIKDLKESKSEKTSINIRESLNNYDKESCSTDLLNMYDSCKLTLEDKQQIVNYILNEDYSELEKYLYNKMK